MTLYSCCKKCGTEYDISSLFDETFECPVCGYKEPNNENKKTIANRYDKFNQSMQVLEDIREKIDGDGTYLSFINKPSTKAFLRKILPFAKSFFEGDENQRIIARILEDSSHNAPFDDYIQEKNTKELLEDIISMILANIEPIPAKIPEYRCHILSCTFSQNEWELLDDFSYFLNDMLN